MCRAILGGFSQESSFSALVCQGIDPHQSPVLVIPVRNSLPSPAERQELRNAQSETGQLKEANPGSHTWAMSM